LRAIILAAGRGKRMKSSTRTMPKCLLEVRGKRLLDWQLSALRGAGIDDVAIVTGYRREMLSGCGLFEFHNPLWKTTDMVASLFCAGDWLAESPCIISYSDIFYDVSLIESMIQTSAPIAVAYDPNWLELWSRRFANPLSDAETFRLNDDNGVIEIGKPARKLEQIQGQYMGLISVTPEGWEEFSLIRSGMSPSEMSNSNMTEFLQKIIDAGRKSILGVPYENYWGEVDSQSDLSLYDTL